jgi:hypothetical protein
LEYVVAAVFGAVTVVAVVAISRVVIILYET